MVKAICDVSRLGFRNEVELWYMRGVKFHAPYHNRYDHIGIEFNKDVDSGIQ